MMFDDLLNANELRDEFIEILKGFDKNQIRYQVDVYLYVADNKGTLYEFINVGGNSWLNDDHFVLYKHKPEVDYEDLFGEYTPEEYMELIDGDFNGYYSEKADTIIEEFNERMRWEEYA